MKSLIAAAAIFASTALAAKYAAGTNCHSNVECNKNCINGQFAIVNLEGGYIFACDPDVPDPTDWYHLTCQPAPDNDVGGGSAQAATEAACDQLGGQFCRRDCILSGKRSADQDNRAKWRQTCGDDLEGYPTWPEIQFQDGEKGAKISCQ
jgi:hypothetical protein